MRRPFLYPLVGPDGIPLTEFGKPHDPTGSHAHHYSLWVAHASVGGKSFWSETEGLIAHEGFDHQEDGPVFCRIVQKTAWVHGETTVLRERRRVTVWATPESFRAIDVDLEFEPCGAAPVTLFTVNNANAPTTGKLGGLAGEGAENGKKQERKKEFKLKINTEQSGLNWEKPNLGQVEFQGNTNNNLVFDTVASWADHNHV